MYYNILIHKYLTGVINAEETNELNKWLSGDPQNKQEFEEIKRIWESAEDEETVQPIDEHFNKDLQILERAIEESSKSGRFIEQNRIRNKYKNALIATLSFILITIGLLVWGFRNIEPTSKIYAGNSKNDELIFSDSSRVLLNDSSSLFLTMTSKVREAELSGEAFFDVKKDKRPFFVYAGDVAVKVLGTSFIVKNEHGSPVEVYVISGSVAVEYQDRKELLSEGERATVTGNDGIHISVNDNPNFNSWYTRDFVFNGTELKGVLTALKKHYRTSFHVTDPPILGCRFTGKFHDAKLEDIIKILSYSMNIKFQIQSENTYVVSGKGCK